MGCFNTKQINKTNTIKDTKQPSASNHEIQSTADQLQIQKYQIQHYACGYNFSNLPQNQQTYSSVQLQNAKLQIQKSKVDNFIDICSKMKQKYLSSQIDDAFRYKQEVKKQYNQIDQTLIPSNWIEQKQQLFVIMEVIQDKYQQINKFVEEFYYQNIVQEDNIYVSINRGEQCLKVCVSTQTSITLDLIAATFACLQKYSQFMKFSTLSTQIRKIGNFSKIGQVHYDLPFCSKNTTYFQQTVYNRLNFNKSVLITYQSLYKNNKLCDDLQFFPIFESEHTIDFSNICCQIQQLNDGKSKLSLLFRIKGEIKGISWWILQKMYKNMAIGSMKKLIQTAKAYGDETASESYESNDEIYYYFNKFLKKTNPTMII